MQKQAASHSGRMQCKRGHSPTPASTRSGAPLQLHPQTAPVEVIAIAALGCLLGIPEPARETGGGLACVPPSKVPRRCLVLPSQSYESQQFQGGEAQLQASNVAA